MKEFALEYLNMNRREFLRLCGAVAGMLGLSELHVPRIAEAIEGNAMRPPVIWLNFSSDSGCTESFIKTAYPPIEKVVLDLLSIEFNETIQAAAGKQAEEALYGAVERYRGEYVCAVEGGIPMADDGRWLTIADKTGIEVLREIARDAKVILAVGSCAFDGCIVRATPNPSEVRGVMEIDGIDRSKLINLPGCPCNPRWVIATVAHLLVMGTMPEMDQYMRPKMIYGQLVHDNCERRAHFEAGRFVEEFGSREAELGYCLYKMGCKGPVAYANCPVVRFNDHANWCVGAGSPCIGCTELNYTDRHAPFYERLPDIKVPGGTGIEVAANRVGIGVGIATAVGIGAHLIGRVATGRWGKGEPSEKSED